MIYFFTYIGYFVFAYLVLYIFFPLDDDVDRWWIALISAGVATLIVLGMRTF